MDSSFSQNLKLGFGISLVLLIASSLASYFTINKLINSSKLVDHTHKVLRVSENMLSSVKDGESGQRGFLLTNDPDFLQPYIGSKERVMEEFKSLRELTKDNVEQQVNCDSLELVIDRRFDKLDLSIDLVRAGYALNPEYLKEGRMLMDQIRLLIQKIQHTENILLDQRTSQLNKFVGFAPIVILVAGILALIITVIFYNRVRNDYKERSELAKALKVKDAEITNRISIIEKIASKIASGDYSPRLNTEEKDELGSLSISLNKMASSLQETFSRLSGSEWLQTGAAGLSEVMTGEKEIKQLSNDSINFLADYTGSQVGAIYLVNAGNVLSITGGFALPSSLLGKYLQKGEGLAGECFKSGKQLLVKDAEPDIYTTFSGGQLNPRQLVFTPILFEGKSIGVIELGTIHEFTDKHLEFLDKVSELVGISINMAENRSRLKELLEETQAQSEELQAQHSELENINAELEVQSEKLQTSEEELKVQQEELMETNQELEERSRLLEEKNHLIVIRNLEIQKKSEELEMSSRYKSEFFANMSHELRTPLNSVLLLSRLLSENNHGNLTPDQVEYAQVIQNSGHGLLQLIDEILDLSKIEAGKLELEYEKTEMDEVVMNMKQLFQPMAKEKKVEFIITVDKDVPSIIETDRQRLEQILKNLISNALKFTHKGSIELLITNAVAPNNGVSFSVIDTGIGIPEDKQQLIFEAFQQADGSTKRKYGGTGLGLSISRQLARLLNGDIHLVSSTGSGSTFTLTIPYFKDQVKVMPLEAPPTASIRETVTVEPTSPYIAQVIPPSLPDDRAAIGPDDKVILIVEDDITFAKALLDFARSKKYKAIHVVRGDEVLNTASRYKPLGILLDIQLPIMDGLSVIDELKNDYRTRHIPVHIMSSFEAKKESITRGAIDFINKPVMYDQMDSILKKIEHSIKNQNKKVLIVEDNSYHAKALAYFLSTQKVHATISEDINHSIDSLKQQEINCVILDMGLPGKKGYEALELVKQNAELENIPIIIFTGNSLSRNEEQRIRQYADAIVVKTANSYQRILNEVSLFLHLVEQPEGKKNRVFKATGKMEEVLKNRTVLVADDDVRNIFALTKALEKHKMNVVTAVDGKEAIGLLETTKVDIVLMDMMMPEMDGYETISMIRNNRKWKNLPVIAVTAKAMTGDREKCLQAGASDYISKPVDTDQLLSLIRVWLYETL